jgi:small-conductance mechanosensitive channel
MKIGGPITALAAGALCAIVLASCGSSGGSDALLSPDSAANLNDILDSIQQEAADGSCSSAASDAQTAADSIQGSTGKLDPQLKTALVDGFQRLQVLASDPSTCGSVSTQETTTEETTTTEKTETEPTTTEAPPPTETQAPPPTETQTQPTTTGTGGTPGNGGGPGL